MKRVDVLAVHDAISRILMRWAEALVGILPDVLASCTSNRGGLLGLVRMHVLGGRGDGGIGERGGLGRVVARAVAEQW